MVTKVTAGVKISVETLYVETLSNPQKNHYFFSYKITIENLSNFAFQLMKRHWQIFDSAGIYNQVQGDGVIGKTPIIEPGESFTYESGCNLTSDIGTMYGTYLMQKTSDKTQFEVQIPEFLMMVPNRLN
jgi:ApaG protein